MNNADERQSRKEKAIDLKELLRLNFPHILFSVRSRTRKSTIDVIWVEYRGDEATGEDIKRVTKQLVRGTDCDGGCVDADGCRYWIKMASEPPSATAKKYQAKYRGIDDLWEVPNE